MLKLNTYKNTHKQTNQTTIYLRLPATTLEKHAHKCHRQADCGKKLHTAGDIESNPGPTTIQDPDFITLLFSADSHNPKLVGAARHTTDFTFPSKTLYNIQPFNIEEFIYCWQGWEHVKKLYHNILCSCDACSSLENCMQIYLTMHIKTKVTLSNILITTILECLEEYRCMYCLDPSGDYQGNFMPKGTVCCFNCEQNYMNNFIIPWSFFKHRVRALWIKYLGLKTMNNIRRTPTCKEHYNYKICLADSVDVQRIKTWLGYPNNTIKERKKRDRTNCAFLGEQELAEKILQLAAGEICVGRNCFKTLWLYTGPSELDACDLQYCTPACLRTRRSREKDYHISKLHTIQRLEDK